MNSTRLRELRAGKRASLETLGTVIGKSVVSYGKKERGEVPFKPEDVLALSKFYDLSFNEMNAIFYDSKLPIGNFDDFCSVVKVLGT